MQPRRHSQPLLLSCGTHSTVGLEKGNCIKPEVWIVTTSIEREIRIDSLPTQLRVPTEEQIFPLVWDYMARRIDIREDVYDRSVRKKEQEKDRYDRGVQVQYFKLGEFVLLKDSTPHLGKLTERWRGPFIIDSFGGDHGASYVLKTLDGEPAPNTHHGDHLRLFRPREGYLRPTDEEPLAVTRNLRFRGRRGVLKTHLLTPLEAADLSEGELWRKEN